MAPLPLPLLQLPPSIGFTPADAIRDSVRALARDAAFRRSLRESLVERFWRWLGDLLSRMFDAARDVPHAQRIAIALLVLLVLLVAARIILASRLGEEARVRGGAPGRRRGTDPLLEAERLAAEGAWLEAAHALHRAALEVIARYHGVRLHPSKTSGDYVRELRRRGTPAHAPFRQFTRRYERMVFGHAPCDAAGWTALREDLATLVGRERAA